MKPISALLSFFAAFPTLVAAASTAPIAAADLVFAERGGLVAVEAEHFIRQERTEVRAWHLFTPLQRPRIAPDKDGTHLKNASGGAYLEILPDSRWSHDEKLVHGENFSDSPGTLAIVSYRVHFSTPGRYHFWARVHSTGSEDNGLHVGLNGAWPESGRRWQTVKKNSWHWDSRQRTREVHAGVPGQLFLDVPTAGEHLIQVSMREDGIELDKWLMTTDAAYVPEGTGPAPEAASGSIPPAFAQPASLSEDPAPSAKAHGAAKAAATGSEPAAGEHGQSRLALARGQRERLFRPVAARLPHGDGTTRLVGELRQWHAVTLELAGPFAAETDTSPNPFTDYRYEVTFTHASGSPSYTVPGYFAADGRAAETSATTGTIWRAHLSPDQPGLWRYRVAFIRGPRAATHGGGEPLAPYHGQAGEFIIERTNKTGPDFRAGGRLVYREKHYLIRAGTGEPFLKAGADAPETLLASADFDDTLALKQEVPLKTWKPHLTDWRPGDPTWQGSKGKGLIGALNYLAGKGVNAVSFLTYNAAGDGDNVWPFVARDTKLHYDCSRLDQWGIVFAHAQARGVFLHFKLQENENDDHRAGPRKIPREIPEALDGGRTDVERRLYLRELVARFGHHLALNWNLGEENTQSAEEQRAMARYLGDIDPYDHLIVIHSFPEQQEAVYQALLGRESGLTGASAQNSWKAAHRQTLRWVRASAAAGRPWVVCNDEQNPANQGVPPDPGYRDYAGRNAAGRDVGYDLHDIRKATLWGTLLAGGAGIEYYFGYQLPENDLLLEDFRSRDRSWDYCRIALEFFAREKVPLLAMANADELVGNPAHDNAAYCLAQPGEHYLVYLPSGGSRVLDLTAARGEFALAWFDPRNGGAPQPAGRIAGGGPRTLTAPTSGDDWLAVIRR